MKRGIETKPTALSTPSKQTIKPFEKQQKKVRGAKTTPKCETNGNKENPNRYPENKNRTKQKQNRYNHCNETAQKKPQTNDPHVLKIWKSKDNKTQNKTSYMSYGVKW